MPRRPSYDIVAVDDATVMLRDTSNIHGGLSLTNGVEAVVAELFRAGTLCNHHRLVYYDSDGQLDEIIHNNGKFKEFRCLPATFRELTRQIRTSWQQVHGQNTQTGL